jgi:hypothetical protein
VQREADVLQRPGQSEVDQKTRFDYSCATPLLQLNLRHRGP